MQSIELFAHLQMVAILSSTSQHQVPTAQWDWLRSFKSLSSWEWPGTMGWDGLLLGWQCQDVVLVRACCEETFSTIEKIMDHQEQVGLAAGLRVVPLSADEPSAPRRTTHQENCFGRSKVEHPIQITKNKDQHSSYSATN